jgi:DNA-binding transcriptional regulator YdaS (Cro superfamily)
MDFVKSDQIRIIENAVSLLGSVEALATHLNVSRVTVSRWKNGVHSIKGEYIFEIQRLSDKYLSMKKKG